MSSNTIDLHAHTLYSDGSVSPEELVAMASRAGAQAIAITDHDTTDGLREGRAAAESLGIEFINGIEISAEHQPGTMHILGYYIDDESTVLQSKLAELKHARKERNPEIANRLRSLGVDIDYDEVVALAGGEVVGRPHFARLMIKKGYAQSMQDAFNRYLAKGAPAFVDKRRLSPSDSIDLIHKAGGLAVLAHPYQLKPLSLEGQERLIAHLASLGLDGIEAVYSRHSEEQREVYAKIAARYGLLVTGGSDFHGSYKPDINIVTGLGDLRVPYSLLEALKRRAGVSTGGADPQTTD